ncbi:ATP-binding cassette domain-containing protein [Microbacteriaceae bacterium VKM Ac-2855]|nr:ATP-binding cassette domain-containing protein [Microbacteriaceae bacterium VKM Ac-2855]
MLECIGLHKRYDADNHPLQGVDLVVDAGEFVAITGPSGSGKSTLLNILGLLDRPTEGEYRIDGEPTDAMDRRRLDDVRGRRFGFVFQASHLITGRTVAQNLAVGLASADPASDAVMDDIRRALRSVGLEHKVATRVELLSGGEKQRVAIARALVHSPAVLMLDEPTGSLDEDNTEAVLRVVEGLRDRGLALVIVTHDLAIAARADRHLTMQHGRLIDVRRATSAPPRSAAPRRTAQVRPTRWRRARLTTRDAALGLLSKPARAIMAVGIIALGAGGYVAAGALTATASEQVDASFQEAAGDMVRLNPSPSADRDVGAEDATRLETVDGVLSVGLRWDLTDLRGAVARTFGSAGATDVPGLAVSALGGEAMDTLDIVTAPATAVDLLAGPPAVADGVAVIGPAAATALGIVPGTPGVALWIGDRSFSVVGKIESAGPQAGELGRSILISAGARESVSNRSTTGLLLVKTRPGMAKAVADIAPLALDAAHPEFFDVETTADLARLRGRINGQLDLLIRNTGIVLLALAVLATVAAGWNGVNARRSEIGLRRALGATRAQIGALFIAESVLTGVVGGALGTALGIAVVIVGSTAQGWTPVIGVSLLVTGPALGAGVGAAAAALPAWRSAAVDPARELRA